MNAASDSGSRSARAAASGRPLWLWLASRFVLAGVLPLLLVAALLLSVHLPQARDEIDSRQQALASSIASQIAVHLLGAERELSAIATHLRLRGEQAPSFWFDALDAHAGFGKVFTAIYIVDADDAVYAVGLPAGLRGQRRELLQADLSGVNALRQARTRGAPMWSEVSVSEVSARRAVSLAIPVGEQALLGEVAIDRLAEFLERLPGEAGMASMILDARGQFIASSLRTDDARQLGFAQLPSLGDGEHGRFRGRDFVWAGEPFIGTLVAVPPLGWRVLVAQPRSEAYAPFRSTLWALAAGLLAALLLAVSATWMVARGFARRIGGYTVQAQAIADGDYEQPWPVTQVRELDSLAGHLDRMSVAIRQRERQLAISEMRYRSLISKLPLVIFQFDAQGIFTLSEGKGLLKAGLIPGSTVGQSIFSLYRDYPEVCAKARRALAGEALHFTLQVHDTAFETYFTPIGEAAGALEVIGVAVDISERVRVEEQLQQANRVVANNPAMLFRWRAEEGWPALFVSDNVSQLGYSSAELLDGSIRFATLIHPDDLTRVGAEVAAYTEQGKDRFQQEYRVVCRDGTIRWVDDRTAIERDAAGKVTHYLGIVIDISDRKHAEQALHSVNRQLRIISECNQALIRATDESELLSTVCEIVVQVGGYRMAWVGYAESDVAKSVRPVAHAGHECGYLAQMEFSWADSAHGRGANGIAIRSGRPCVMANIARDPDFAPWRDDAIERGYAALCALPLRDGERILGALSIYAATLGAFDAEEVALLSELAEDLSFGIAVLRARSEREQSEQALRDSEARYRLLFDSNPHPMWVYDLGTLAFLAVNDAALRKYGYSREEFLSMTVSDIRLNDDTPLLLADVVSVEETDDGPGVWQHLTKNGTLIDVEIVAHEISYQGRPAQLVLAEDITARRRAEAALLESELQYRQLVENANSIILRWSPEGRINFINDFGLKFFGYAGEELLGQHVIGTIVPPYESGGKDLRPLIQDICRNPESFERNINENIRRSGERVWVSWANRAISNEHGEVVEVFSVGSDITERRRVEEELRQYREHLEELVAERTNELRQAMAQLLQAEKLAALGNLVAGVAHELNTPLGNARVVAGVLSEQFREFADAVASGHLNRVQVDTLLNRGREALDLLDRNTTRAAELIGHFKQVAVDQSSARRRSFALRQTVEEMLVTLRPGFKHSRHRIELKIPSDLEMDSYPGPLEQVIANLVENSLAHGFEGIEEGRIEITAHTVAPDQVILRYVDNGKGIPAEILNRIFEPFFTTRLGQGGSGLGLYIVYNLVTAVLGGSIEVESRPGQGTRFTLTLPRSAPERVVGG
ncbi:MAG: Sporulation kinase A [Candidatus Accumulibacter appositus]|uniref:histidine kinase n=1 Tax=Candidatus Accumulibacter appositus TaxID=1454003 RepID=A0A011N7W5_9PROT|nr:PAS domain S-box protein [Accumulibacter sp.]EXI78693.1 MAG: Sporulation kinase A [Candidatus Accumulibacter appositus]HRF03352.1 PAS domain S-box protein [Accumulibacter sp.]